MSFVKMNIVSQQYALIQSDVRELMHQESCTLPSETMVS